MAAYPTNPSWAFPVVRTLEFKTYVCTSENGTEQRWPLTTGEERFTLTYSTLTLSQRDTLLSAFNDAKGSFDQTLSLDFLGDTYTGMNFAEDELSFVERTPSIWSGTVTLVQSVRTADSTSLGSSFPTLVSGAAVQLPFSHTRSFLNTTGRTEGGRFVWNRRATTLRSWSAGGTGLVDADAVALWNYFRLAYGRYRTFAFTDPTNSTTYSNCRFASDTLEWRYLDRDFNALEVVIQEHP